MGKKFNMLALIVLLVFQTMLAPVAVTAQGLDQQDLNAETSEELVNVNEETDILVEGETSENLNSSDDEAGESGENEGSENEAADEEEAAENDAPEDENESDTNESEDGTEEKVNEPDEEVTEEEESVSEESEEDEKANGAIEEEESSVNTQAIEPLADLGDIFEFHYFQLNGEDVVDGHEIDFNSKYKLEYKWDTKLKEVKAGDTARLQLPDAFKQYPDNTPPQDIMTSEGIAVGTYTIHGGELVFTFDEDIEDADVHNGVVGLDLDFDIEKFSEQWVQDIDFDGDGVKDVTVVAKPTEVETKLVKEGHPDKDKDAREITWSVDIVNGNEEAITNGVLKDILPEGVGEPRDFVVKEFTFDFDGNKVVGEEVAFNEPTVNGNEFELTFDEVPARGGYTVEYTTTITDYTINQFTNDATFTADDVNLDTKTTVTTGERSNPIQKSGNYNWNTGQIDWTIIVNENGSEIANAIVDDVFPEGLTLVDNSIKVTKNWNEVEGLNPTEFPIELGPVNSDEVYRISFSTDINWSDVNEGEYTQNNKFINETELTDGEDPRGKATAEVDVWRENLLSKSGNANDYNYENKVLTWTLDVNKAKHPINNAVITDILPAGLDIQESDIVIKNEAGDDVAADKITITVLDDGRTEVKIELGDIGTETLKVTYETEVEDFVENNFKNEATLDGEGIGEDTPKDDATVQPPGNSFTKDFKGIDYSEKTMDWTITVDPKREAITELEITDTFPNKGMILLPNSVVVKVGGTDLVEGTDYTLAPNTTDGETGYNKGFTINLINIDQDSPLNEQLTVDFKTSYDPQLEVEGNTADDHTGDPTLYTNHAGFTGKTVNGHDIDEEDDASTRVREDSWNSGKKEGQLVHEDTDGNLVAGWESGSERKIAWQLYTNYQKQNLGTDVVITDTLAYEGTIDEDSIKVSIYEVSAEGETTITDETIDDYTVDVDGKEFTLTFVDGFVVGERYVVEFTTTVPDVSQEKYTNNATVKVGDKEYPFDGTVGYDNWNDYLDKQALGQEGTEVFIGEELEWEVKVNESLSVIRNAKVTDTINSGHVYLNDSLVIKKIDGTELVEGENYTLNSDTNDEGVTELNITFVPTTLSETLVLNYKTVVTGDDGDPVNNKVDLSGSDLAMKSTETSELTAKQFTWVGGDYNPRRGVIKVNKVDSNTNEVINTGEATFELWYDLNGERVQFGEEFKTINGVLEVGNLPLRTYYLIEKESPNGYVLSDEEIEIVVNKSFNDIQENIFEVDFENIAEDEISVEKVWNDAENQDGIRPPSVTVNLLANGEIVETATLTESDNWSTTFAGLSPVDENGETIEYTVEEVAVEGYEKAIVGSAEEGFVITNTHEPELINIDGTKTWEDADDQDGKRPDSITVRLLANGEEVASVEVTDWTFEFTDLPKFENGEEITYTIQEDDVTDYSTTIENYDITNSYTPGKTSINVVKTWNDEENQDGLRPNEITVKLFADGEETDQVVVLDAANNWQADFTDLDVNKAGEPIVYTVEEVAVEGYEANITGTPEEGFVISNTHEPELINLEGTKTWEDADDQDGVRPDSITVRLLSNGTEVEHVEVTAETEWKYEFTNLPKYEDGTEIAYTIQEDNVEDYSTEIDGLNITNSYTPEQTSINVVKAWEDTNNQDGIRLDSITVKLLADGEETGKEQILNADNNWQADFTELDVNKAGEPIVYTVEEVAVNGYETSITGSAADGFVITNTHEPELIDLEGTKTWDDADNQDGKRPESITVRLLANGEEIDAVEVTEEDEWSYSFTDLPKFENGEEITYTIQEDDIEVEGYSTEIDGFNITNSYTPEVIEVAGTKTWVDEGNQDGKRPSEITVKLLADGEEIDAIEVAAADEWKYVFDNLPKYANGEEIVYTIDEVTVEGYETTISGFNIMNSYTPEVTDITVNKVWEDADNQDGIRLDFITVKLLADGEETGEEVELNAENDWQSDFTDLAVFANGEEIVYTVEELAEAGYDVNITGTPEEGFVITNTHEPELININGTKTWDDADNQDGKRPDFITVRLLANGEEVESVEVTEATDWTFEFTDFPKFENGEVINYTVQEDDVEGYSTEIDGLNITNSYTPGKTSINVVKAWDDENDQDGIRQNEITVKLLANGEETGKEQILNADNNWQADFTDLDVNEAGEPIVYTVEEVAVDGYETSITGSAADGFVITNTHEPELIDLEGTKTWDDLNDQDRKRPDSITVRLLANGEEVESIEVTAESDWTFGFADLPKFENGEEITYTVQEDNVEEYSTEIDGFDITNSYTPGKTSINVVKIWEDKENQNDSRPDSITVKLLADGEETDQTVELSEENNWQADFTDLDVNKAGEAIVYTVEEVAVNEYRSNITGDANTGFIITNTQKTYAIGDYTWIDSNKDGIQDEDEEVLPDVIVELYDESGENKLDETTTDENGLYIFDELPAGKYTVKFTLTEEQAAKYVFTKQNADENSTKDSDADPETGWTKVIELNDDNKHLTKDYEDQAFKATEGIDPTWDAGVIEKTPITPIEPAKTKVTVEKVWEGEAKDSVTVNLLADGEKVATVELSEENDWKYTFTDLPTVNDITDEQAIEYTVEEVAVDGYNTKITGNAKEGFVITNTQKTYAIGDYTWIDSNKDGIQDEDEEVLPGVKVELFDEEGNKIAETETDENGRYIFDELPAGKYKVKFTLTEEQAAKYVFTKQNADENSTKDSDADPETGWTKVIELNDDNKHLTKDYEDQDFNATEGIDPTWDAGVIEKTPITPIEPAKTKVTVEKVWEGEAKDSVTINLLADGEKVDSVELSEENDWKHTFADLPTVNEITDEKAIEYTVEEVEVDGYNTEITGNAKEGFVITNTQKTYAIGDYTWIDSNKDGIQDEDEEVLEGVKVELFDEDDNKIAETETDENGRYIFDELPAGKYKVKFTLTEEQAAKYVFTKQNADENSTKDSDADPETGWTKVIELNDDNKHLTKDYEDQDFKATEGIDPTWDAGVIEKTPITPIEPAKTKVDVEKVWKGEAKDSVTINLLADGEEVDSVELSEENEWKHTFTDLPTVNEITDEKAIEYTVEEVEVDGYNTEITGDAKEGFVITNTQKTYAIGDYTWIDSNKDGIQDEDEEVLVGVIVELYDESGENKLDETTTDENGLYIFDELPAGKYTVKFTLTEEQAAKYVFTKQNADENSTKDSDADPETGWTKVIELNDDNKHLTKDYEDQDFKATEGIDPTWDAGVIEKTPITPIEPAKTKVTVEKVWEGEAKDSVTINLLADGEKVDSVELSEENDWKHTFIDLPTVNDITDEKAIEYTVEEVEVDGYNTEITGDVKEGFVITNTQKTYAIGDYTWIDSNKDGIQDEDEEVLPGVKVELFDEEGNKIAETETDENGRYIFDELPAGKYKVKFTLTEEQAKKYKFTKQNAGDDSTVDSDAGEDGWTVVFTLGDENVHLTKDYTDQAFKATEGIDPTWDAGVIEITPEDPEDPEEPTDPSDPEDPKDPEDTEKPTPGEDPKDPEDPEVEKPEGELPKTATSIYNLTLIGFGLMLIGAILFIVRRKKVE